MRQIIFSVFFLFAVFRLFVIPASAASITSLTTNLTNNQLPLYAKLELTLTLNLSYANPFNPPEISVDGLFTSPENQTLTQPGFYYQDYSVTGLGGNEVYTPQGSPVWKIRFTPQETGTYHYQIRVTDSTGSTTSTQQSFTVLASNNPGFIRVSSLNSRYFAYSNSQPFIGRGLNIGWWQFDSRRVGLYQSFFSQMNQSHANLTRIWMTNSGRNQTWIMSVQDDTLGSNYNLEEAYAFDRIVALAEQNGVALLLTLDDVNQYVHNWSVNLYNSALGGPCSYQSCIFTSSAARTYQERLFRNLVARRGYSPSLLSWKFFNETAELEWSDKSH